jgi:phage FluMu protein Com
MIPHTCDVESCPHVEKICPKCKGINLVVKNTHCHHCGAEL